MVKIALTSEQLSPVTTDWSIAIFPNKSLSFRNGWKVLHSCNAIDAAVSEYTQWKSPHYGTTKSRLLLVIFHPYALTIVG